MSAVSSRRRIKTFLAIGCLLAGTLCLAERAEALTYSPLVKALREQKQNPGPEADARVRQAQIEAAVVTCGLPVLLVGYVVVRVCFWPLRQAGKTKPR